MSSAITPTKALVRAWKGLGAPEAANHALVTGPHGLDLARAVRDELAPASLVLVHPDAPPARSRFETTSADLSQLSASQPGAFDLIVVGGGLESGDLSTVRDRVRDVSRLLKPGGVLAAAIDAFAAPDAEQGSYDHLLFPHLARAGDLGDEMQTRALLPASAWRALLQAAGFEITALYGARGQMLPPDFQTTHEARLASYDGIELAGGALRLIALKTEGPA